ALVVSVMAFASSLRDDERAKNKARPCCPDWGSEHERSYVPERRLDGEGVGRSSNDFAVRAGGCIKRPAARVAYWRARRTSSLFPPFPACLLLCFLNVS